MNINNHDISSTGLSIELTGYYDTIRSQEDFDDNFLRLKDGSCREDSFLFTDWGTVDTDNYNVSKEVSITGFSQGQDATVVVPTNLGYKRGFDFAEHFRNLFYRAPCYLLLTVNGEEHWLGEHLKDPYAYEKSDIMSSLKFDNEVMDWLEANLPNELDYL